jgi:hypothetical protein
MKKQDVLAGIVSLGLGIATSAILAADQRPGVPQALAVAAGQALVLKASAKGVQIYTCSAGADGRPAWTLKAPEADLFDAAGKKIGTHYAGPTWESTDGSKVGAAVKARADAPAANSIPWLLLEAKSHSGNGILAHVATVQRIDTAGGAAPEQACDAGGGEQRVPYTATYYFYAAAP